MLENIPLLIYLASVAESFQGFIFPAVLLGIIALVVFTFFVFVDLTEDLPEGEDVKLSSCMAILKKFIFSVLIYLGLCVLIPSEKTMYTMIAAGGAVELVQSDAVQEVGGKSLQLLNQFLESKLEIQDEQSN